MNAVIAFTQERVRDFLISLRESSATDALRKQLQIQNEIAKRLFGIEDCSIKFCKSGRSNGVAADYCLGLYHISGGAICLFQMIVREPRCSSLELRTQNTYHTVSYLAEQFPVPQPVFEYVTCSEDTGLLEKISTEGIELIEEFKRLFDPTYVYQSH